MGVVWGVAGVSLISFIFTSIWYIDPALLTMVLQFQPATCTTVHRYTVHCIQFQSLVLLYTDKLYTVYSFSHLYYCTQVYCTLYTVYSSSRLYYCRQVYLHCIQFQPLALLYKGILYTVHCIQFQPLVLLYTGILYTVHCTQFQPLVLLYVGLRYTVHCTLYTVPATHLFYCTQLYCLVYTVYSSRHLYYYTQVYCICIMV